MKRFAILFLAACASLLTILALTSNSTALVATERELLPTDGWACGCE